MTLSLVSVETRVAADPAAGRIRSVIGAVVEAEYAPS